MYSHVLLLSIQHTFHTTYALDVHLTQKELSHYLAFLCIGLGTACGLDGPGIESRWGARFFAPVQTGPEAHPASCTTGTGSFLRVRCGRDVTLTPDPLLVPRSKIE